MGIIRQSDLVPDLEPWVGVQRPAEEPVASPLDAAWAKATAAASAVDIAANAFGGLDKAANDLTDGETNPSEWARRFDEAVGKLPVDGLPDEDLADFQAVARMQANRLKVAAVRRQREDAVAQFESDLDGYVQRAADAPSNAIEATFRNQAFRAIERIDQAGLLGPGVADRLRAELPVRIDRALAMRAIERDPAHAAALLTQPGALPALDDAERARLARKAGLRAERQSHETFLAEVRNRAGAFAELWLRRDSLDDTDIDAGVADGRLLASDAAVLRERLRADRAAQQWRLDAIDRVEAVLRGEGALDPASPADRNAVDAHFAEAERAWDDHQVPADLRPALIGAYVGRTGMLPAALKKSITSAFRAGDANRQNEAADIVAAIGRSAGRGVLVELPVEDLLPSILILSLRDSGLDPAAAAARAAAIVSGDVQARDHNVRRDLAAAGKWAEDSGCFDTGRIVRLRERLKKFMVPGTRHPPAADALGFRTMKFRRGRDEPVVSDLLHRPGNVTRPIPLAAAGDGGQNATPGEGGPDRPVKAETSTPIDSPSDIKSAQAAPSGDKKTSKGSANKATDPAARRPVHREWRDRIAERESQGKPDGGYGAVNPNSGNLGRYQLGLDGLQQIGMRRPDGSWTGKYGVQSQDDFLRDHDVQERALDEYVADNQRQLKYFGIYRHIGQVIDGKNERFPITESGLAAAAHREGPGAVRGYMRYLQSRNWKADYDDLQKTTRDKYLRIETRLREFAIVPLR